MTKNSNHKDNPVRLFFQLIKITITLPVTFLAFIGYNLVETSFNFRVLLVSLGVFLLAGAASTLNQIIEMRYDSIMERTRKRPLPAGKVSLTYAWTVVLILTTGGILILSTFNWSAVLLGIITLFWYIFIYTYLKRVTAFAVIPGSLTGALPPLIGWVAAGGIISHPLIIYVAFFVFIWQIPHFWLLVLKYGREYQQAGFPSLYDYYDEKQIQTWTFIWILFSSVYSLILPIFRGNKLEILPILMISGYLTLISYKGLIKHPTQKGIRFLFHLINLFMILILLIILIFEYQ